MRRRERAVRPDARTGLIIVACAVVVAFAAWRIVSLEWDAATVLEVTLARR